jgi:biofilm PGA synthesis lipoprotein PgaB
MYRVLVFILLNILVVLNFTCSVVAKEMKEGEFLVIVYHAIVENPTDEYSVSRKDFVEQMEYLRTHGFHPISLDDILKASRGEKKLPPKPVLIAFDDGYISYYEFVVPVLEEFGYPSVVAISGGYVDNPPKDIPEPVMSWDQIRELASKELVEIVSHTYGLHRAIQYNSVGNVGPALYVRAYDPLTKRYETEEEYRERIERDFEKQEEVFKKRLGFKPRAIVWPFGKYTTISKEIAIERGYEMCFTSFDGYADLNSLYEIKRNFVMNEPMEEFIEMVNQSSKFQYYVRAVQVDLDLIYDPESYEKTDENLGKLIDRLVAMKVNTVFLQAFSDPEGTGNIKSVYFPNRVLPMKADIFSHAVHQIKIRDIDVYAWMPVLSIELPDEELNQSLKVVSRPEEKKSWYNRLSPFSEKAKEIMRMLYEDLAAHSLIQGVLFQDDAYLTDYEDFHPEALKKYKEHFGVDFQKVNIKEDPELMKQWSRYKTEVLIDFTKELMKSVRKYRPETYFARNIYAPLLTEPESEEWFAQNYELFLDNYDYVVVMAYPYMEGVKKPSKWLKKLVKVAKGFKPGIKKTVFKLQSYDWQKEEWIDDWELLSQMRDVLASGGINIVYYPDNVWDDRPALDVIKLEMSTQDYPFLP